MANLECVFYHPIDSRQEEIGRPVRIDLRSDGAADVSRLPDDLRKRLERSGVSDPFGGVVFPEAGSKFLELLLISSSGYERFRTSDSIQRL
ncbi:MAG TPA: hypothetical protein VFQ60_01895 [Patescibacteria group bacterium]|nr:hypothetical protein [Patescibacteria group bacterium]